MRRWSEHRKAVAFTAVVGVSVVGLLWAGALLNRVDVSGTPSVAGIRMHIEGATRALWYNATATRNVTAFTFLLEASAVRGFEVTWSRWSPPLSAVLVTSIGGDGNGADGRYWQFWIDGRYASVGADHAVLHDGAFVEWRFVPSQEACCR